MGEKIKTWTLRFPAEENPDTGKALFDWPIALQYYVKATYRMIPRKFSGMTFFHPGVRLTNQSHARLYPFDKPIKSLYLRSFVVSVLFALFISRSYENNSNLGHAGLSSSLSGLFHKSSPQSSHRSKSPPHCLPAALYDISRKMTIVSSGFLRKFDINNS